MNTIDRRSFIKGMGWACAGAVCGGRLGRAAEVVAQHAPNRTAGMPNIVLIMTDDQGWGETGYYDHPVLKTPHLDAMAANGLRFDRFYAAAPVCSPTRATVLTGRANDRTGVFDHGFPLRLQEKTLPQALRRLGYRTAHFGKWHLNGIRGPGVPILKDDPYGPGAAGFDEWLSATNYFDLNPVLSRNGDFEAFKGDPSTVIVTEALAFIRRCVASEQPFFAVIWDGSPHRPWSPLPEDKEPFPDLDEQSRCHYGEMVAFDRSVGLLRTGLRDQQASDNTMVWYCSDNGGLGGVEPGTVGGLRGLKASSWEGGLRVPCIVEYPDGIRPRVTDYPASTMDIFPTIAAMLNMPQADMLKPLDGISLAPLFDGPISRREQPIPFRYRKQRALVDNQYKIVTQNIEDEPFALYDLDRDHAETTDVAGENQEVYARLLEHYQEWNASVEASVKGHDYPPGTVVENVQPRGWGQDERYQALFPEWAEKPEFRKIMWYLNRGKK